MQKDGHKEWVERTLSLGNTKRFTGVDGTHYALRVLGRGLHLGFSVNATVYVFNYEWVDQSIYPFNVRAWNAAGDINLSQDAALEIAIITKTIWSNIYGEDSLTLRTVDKPLG